MEVTEDLEVEVAEVPHTEAEEAEEDILEAEAELILVAEVAQVPTIQEKIKQTKVQ